MLDDNLPLNDEAAANSGESNPPETPSYVTAEQLNQSLSQLTQTFQAGLAAIAQARNADPLTPTLHNPIALPNDNEIIEEIQAGGLSKLRQLVNGAVEKVRREEVLPFQENGTRLLAEQAKTLAVMSGAMPHYKRFQKEIDDMVGRLPANQRTSAEVYQGIHDLVVGKNIKIVTQEALEASVRAARDAANTSLPGSQGGRQSERKVDPNAIPTFESIYGDEGVKALSHLGKGGRNADGFAQNLGYKDWATYYTDVLKPAGVTSNV